MAGTELFTVITKDRAFRVRARSEAHLRTVFADVGLPILAVDRDVEVSPLSIGERLGPPGS